VLQLFNWGGVAGALIGALVIQQLGSRIAMIGMSLIAIATSMVLAGMTIQAPASLLLMTFMIVTGALLNGVQTTMYALASHVYPTEIRGTGVGAAVAFGRIGNVLAAPVANGALDRGGNPAYFGAWAVTMGLVTLALAALKRHIPRSSDLKTAAVEKI
jgi:AAHS family 4-hydroxybenzoate transporter-like MFS transporter